MLTENTPGGRCEMKLPSKVRRPFLQITGVRKRVREGASRRGREQE